MKDLPVGLKASDVEEAFSRWVYGHLILLSGLCFKYHCTKFATAFEVMGGRGG